VYFRLDFNIHEGKLASFEQTAKAMIAGTQNEPGTLAFEWYLSEDHKSCRLLETYANADAMQSHVKSTVVRELLPKLLESASLAAFEVYGEPGPEGRRLLARSGPAIYEFHQGLGR
jgi:quinol monooxygenase YgiN